MKDFGTLLLRMFFAKNWSAEDGPTEYATWEDVTAVMFDVAKMATQAADKYEAVWEPGAVEALDTWLMEIAESGQFDGRTTVPRDAAREMERRAKYAVVASELEAKRGSPLNLPFPAEAPDDMKGWGLVLYVLGGPARDYPEQFAT
ncbi:MAG: hypothetical protein EP318_06160 [Rhodobacteraceae bacterium]|nr:MAG: hypothetical protein EP318_06160 [Paracoccaceae bacterium]